MHLLPFIFSALAGVFSGGEAQPWAGRVADCLRQGPVEVLAADAPNGVVAVACGLGGDRLVVMANGSDGPQRVSRAEATPLVPLYATNADPAVVPSLLVTLFEAGGVAYSNEIPPRTAVVFRPAEPADVRPRGLDE